MMSDASHDSFPDGPAAPFGADTFGNGHLGKWIADADGLPAYEYTLDQTSDPRAAYFVTEGESRDHWHLVGNDRISATAHNGGYVQLYDWTRGPKVLNRWDPARQRYSGGFHFIESGGDVSNTLWEHLPAGAHQRRVFGIGYFEKITTHRGLVVRERIEAPPGDDPVLLSRFAIENTGPAPCRGSWVEFWAANLYQITSAPIMTHRLARLFDWRRRNLNHQFLMDATWDDSIPALMVHFSYAGSKHIPPRDKPSSVDYHPATLFLAPLDRLGFEFDSYAADGAAFFGKNGLEAPPGAHGAADGSLVRRQFVYEGNAVLALRYPFNLAPGEKKEWTHFVGYARPEHIGGMIEKYRQHPQSPPRPVVDFTTDRTPWLRRELAWHSYYLQAGTVYQEFFDTHFIDQGSAYSYLQGLFGAHRDFMLFVLPMVYLRPALAKEMLRFSLRSQYHKNGALPYLHEGHGKAAGFLIHGRSSDLDLFLLWGLAEYLGVTRDTAFLAEMLPYYPPSKGKAGTVLEHARDAFGHLTRKIGTGPHGLLRSGTGDWNDQWLAFSRWPLLTARRGESAFNAALAAVALPALADVLALADAAFAEQLRAFAAGQKKALEPLWTGEWMARGYLGYGSAKLGEDRIFLDAQPFGILAGVWDEARNRQLLDTIWKFCVGPQPAGALCLWPPMKRGPILEVGSDTNGGTWAAVDSWLAWAWARVEPKQAWEFFVRTTLAARAEAYPDLWYGIWSGPDSFNAHYHPRPGGTFNITFTPMTDFPVMNMNRHSGILLDAIRLCGIEPRGGALEIDPRLPFDTFTLRTPTISVSYEPRRHIGCYEPVAAGTFRFAVRPPSGLDPQHMTLKSEGRDIPFTINPAGLACFDLTGEPAQRIRWVLEPR